MLTSTRLSVIYHLQAATNSLNQLCRKPLATMMTTVVIAIALALPALFWTFVDNLHHLTTYWQSNGNISLYLNKSITQPDQEAFLKQIQAMPEVGQVTLQSAEEGLQTITGQEGMQDIMRYLPDNPLPPVMEVMPALAVNSPAKLEKLYQQLKSRPFVEEAKLDLQWISRMHALLGFAQKTANALMLLLALAVVLVIGNTLRLAIHNRHEEIQVLKLIGATDSFILRPFLYSGIWYGFVGAILAVLLVNISILSLGQALNQFIGLYQMHYPFNGMSSRQILYLLSFAVILGWLGAWLSVKRQLASIEPY